MKPSKGAKGKTARRTSASAGKPGAQSRRAKIKRDHTEDKPAK